MIQAIQKGIKSGRAKITFIAATLNRH